MTKRFEYYDDESGIGEFAFGNTVYESQTFTPLISHRATFFRPYMRRVSGTPSTLTVELKAVDGSGKPTGAALASGTVEPGAWALTDDWHWITISGSPTLVAGTTYAWVLSYSGVSQLAWHNITAGTYTGGNGAESLDSGATWSAAYGDFAFEEWGNAVDTLQHISIGGKVAAGLAVARNS